MGGAERWLEEAAFGEAIRQLRRERQWTVKELIERLEQRGHKISPAYITRIEQYGEIPSPELTLRLAEVFQVEGDKLLACAKRHKTRQLIEMMEQRYQLAAGMYRTQRKRP